MKHRWSGFFMESKEQQALHGQRLARAKQAQRITLVASDDCDPRQVVRT